MLETAFHVIKITVILLVAAVFMIAINVLMQLIVEFVIPPVIPEIFGLLSCCLPFNALAVFSAIGGATSAILGFLVAKKIFDLTSWSISAA